MLDTTQNCCRSRLALDHKLLTNFSLSCQKISQNISKSLVCHRSKGVFYPALGFYTLDLWPCQPWSPIEACEVVNLILKWNKLWKKIGDSSKIRNISNLYLHSTKQPPLYWWYSPLYWCYPPLYWRYPHCTKYPPQYWCYPPHVLMLSPNVLNILHSTEAILPLYWCNPPLYWTTSAALKVSPTVLSIEC